MPTEYKLYYEDESELYRNQTKENKKIIHLEMIKMAKERGIKPTARFYKTYPSTVRNIIKRYENKEH